VLRSALACWVQMPGALRWLVWSPADFTFNANTPMARAQTIFFLLKSAPDVGLALGGGQVDAYRQVLALPPEDLPDLGFPLAEIHPLLAPHSLRFDHSFAPHGEAWIVRFQN